MPKNHNLVVRLDQNEKAAIAAAAHAQGVTVSTLIRGAALSLIQKQATAEANNDNGAYQQPGSRLAMA